MCFGKTKSLYHKSILSANPTFAIISVHDVHIALHRPILASLYTFCSLAEERMAHRPFAGTYAGTWLVFTMHEHIETDRCDSRHHNRANHCNTHRTGTHEHRADSSQKAEVSGVDGESDDCNGGGGSNYRHNKQLAVSSWQLAPCNPAPVTAVSDPIYRVAAFPPLRSLL